MPATPSQERYVIPNLRNACRILKLLGRSPDGLKGADIGRTLAIPVTTTLRIMTTLHLEGLVRKNVLVKVLGDGKLAVKVDVTANKFSGSAREAITAAGGTATEL